jgi:uncharacterized protein YukJ
VPLASYGVLKARAVDRRREGSTDTPHYQVRLVDDGRTDYRAAVNVMSQQSPSDLLYLIDNDLQHPVTSRLDDLASGWHRLRSGSEGPNLDFIRGNLFDPGKLRSLPPDVTGPDNDLADLLDHHVRRAIGTSTAEVYAFGQRWGPEPGAADKVFGFLPGNGVHDIHMNQGNSGQFRRDDGVWQDGGLLLHFPGEGRWVGIFLAFQSQVWHTDDATGHALDLTPPRAEAAPAAVQIVAAMVNPVGPAPEHESVLLLNRSSDDVDLTGWQIADRMRRTCRVPSGPIAAGTTLEAPVTDGVQLGNRGGSITLLDARGLKVSGVSYTAAQAEREGWTIAF